MLKACSDWLLKTPKIICHSPNNIVRFAGIMFLHYITSLLEYTRKLRTACSLQSQWLAASNVVTNHSSVNIHH